MLEIQIKPFKHKDLNHLLHPTSVHLFLIVIRSAAVLEAILAVNG